MAAFFSGTDDKYELGDPGIHLVVGSIKVDANSYSIAASVVGNGRRFVMHYNNLIDATPVEGVTFHPKVLDYVDDSPFVTTYTATGSAVVPWKSKVGTYSGSNYDSYKYNQWLQKYSFPPEKGYNDPFHYSENYNDRMYGNTREVKYWEVEDIINDYVNQNQNNIEGLIRLENALKDILTDVEAGIQLVMEGYTNL
jgi:hypothetical protein